MAIIRRPQPPGDAGSRRNLGDKRKGKVESVEHAYTGIINVYALVPGSKPISLNEFLHGTMTVDTTAPRTKLDEDKSVKLSSRHDTHIQKQTVPQGPIRYMWSANRRLHRDGLYIRDSSGSPYGSDITIQNRKSGLSVNTITGDRSVYERILHNQPELRGIYDENNEKDSKDIYKATGVISSLRKPIDNIEVQNAILSQAIRLKVDPTQMESWVRKRLELDALREKKDKLHGQMAHLFQSDKTEADVLKYVMLDQKVSETEARNILNAFYKKYPSAKKKEIIPVSEPEISKQFKGAIPPSVVKVVEKLPISLDDPRIKGQISISQSHSSQFIPLPIEARSTATNLYYTKDDKGGISYFVKVTERSKRKIKARVKRYPIVAYRLSHKKSLPKIKSKKLSNSKKANRCTRSGKLKKSILNKLKCTCKRRRK